MQHSIQCPAVFDLPYTHETRQRLIFIAGGISGCENWQERAVHQLMHSKYIPVNPRRDDFDTSNPKETQFQVDWEHDHIELCPQVMFWFPKETLCPITLLELTKCALLGKRLIVGTDRDYARREDVKHQLRLLRPGISVSTSLNDVLFDCHHGNWR